MTAHAQRDPFRVDGARALVTGASRGIGAAIAVALARAGADLAICARTEQALNGTRGRIQDAGRQVFSIPGDFSTPACAGEAVDRATDVLRGLDIVIHCAGILPTTPEGSPHIAPMAQTTEKSWDAVCTVNLDATAALCRRSMVQLAESRHASMILVSSVAGLMGTPGMEVYAATKAAQISLVRSLAVSGGRNGIRVNALCPGWVETDMTAFVSGTQPVSDWLMAHVPQGRWIKPDAVAHSAVYLASSAARHVTGHTLVVDGGLSIADGGLGGIPKPPSPFAASEA